jgi:hypothetical protein
MPDGLENTKKFLIPVISTTVSLNDEEPETAVVTYRDPKPTPDGEVGLGRLL